MPLSHDITPTHTHTHRLPHTQTHTDTHRHTQTHTDRHTHTHTHTHTDTQTQTQTDTHEKRRRTRRKAKPWLTGTHTESLRHRQHTDRQQHKRPLCCFLNNICPTQIIGLGIEVCIPTAICTQTKGLGLCSHMSSSSFFCFFGPATVCVGVCLGEG